MCVRDNFKSDCSYTEYRKLASTFEERKKDEIQNNIVVSSLDRSTNYLRSLILLMFKFSNEMHKNRSIDLKKIKKKKKEMFLRINSFSSKTTFDTCETQQTHSN